MCVFNKVTCHGAVVTCHSLIPTLPLGLLATVAVIISLTDWVLDIVRKTRYSVKNRWSAAWPSGLTDTK